MLIARVVQRAKIAGNSCWFPLSFSFIKETIRKNFVDTIFPLMLPT